MGTIWNAPERKLVARDIVIMLCMSAHSAGSVPFSVLFPTSRISSWPPACAAQPAGRDPVHTLPSIQHMHTVRFATTGCGRTLTGGSGHVHPPLCTKSKTAAAASLCCQVCWQGSVRPMLSVTSQCAILCFV